MKSPLKQADRSAHGAVSTSLVDFGRNRISVRGRCGEVSDQVPPFHWPGLAQGHPWAMGEVGTSYRRASSPEFAAPCFSSPEFPSSAFQLDESKMKSITSVRSIRCSLLKNLHSPFWVWQRDACQDQGAPHHLAWAGPCVQGRVRLAGYWPVSLI